MQQCLVYSSSIRLDSYMFSSLWSPFQPKKDVFEIFFFFFPSGREDGKHLSSVFWFCFCYVGSAAASSRLFPGNCSGFAGQWDGVTTAFPTKLEGFSSCLQCSILVVDNLNSVSSDFCVPLPGQMLFIALSPDILWSEWIPQPCVRAAACSVCVHCHKALQTLLGRAGLDSL